MMACLREISRFEPCRRAPADFRLNHLEGLDLAGGGGETPGNSPTAGAALPRSAHVMVIEDSR